MIKDRVTLVHGPGGTGKTTVAVEMMILILTYSDRRILVCAETNLAVDNLAERFLQKVDKDFGPVRIGKPAEETKSKSLSDIGLENIVRRKVNPKPGSPFFLSRHKQKLAKVFANSRIVFATCAGSGDPVLHGQKFESVIMDEASMTTEPGALCPLVHGCSHLVMIGDHKQLGPHANDGQSESLFDRISRYQGHAQVQMTFLNMQHRMHPSLCAFPSRTFYNSELMTADGMELQRKPPSGFFGGRDPVRFVEVSEGREGRVGTGSWYNTTEIDCVLEVLNVLLRDESLTASCITVLTFYRAQQMKIKERLLSWKTQSPRVCSVDGFQGKENDIIIVSTVRSGPSLGFCDDERRLNVLLTRAKRGLIVVGNMKTLQLSPLWSEWLKQAKIHRDYREAKG